MINVGIVGYGNLGKGVSLALQKTTDMNLIGVFSRREPKSVKTINNIPVFSIEELKNFKDKIDVLLLCGGSATDLPSTTSEYLKDFNTVDSFDTHAKIPEYFTTLDKVAKENGHLSAISIGWDPGVFSIARALFSSVLPDGKDYTFWGKGVSQGHSDAIRRIEGVKNAIQYTIPREEVVDKIRNGERTDFTTREKHLRECFVVLKHGADEKKVENEIKTMPNYFADYDTIVHFISEEELMEKHSKLPHGGFVLRSGDTTEENSHILELKLKLDSNPEFTGSVLVAFARAVYRLYNEGKRGCVTVLDIPVSYLSSKTNEELRKTLL